MKLLVACLLLAPFLAQALTIYSTRKEQLFAPVIEAYQKQSSQKVTVVYDNEGPLLERLKREGKSTSADLIVLVDAGNLWKLSEDQLLSPLQSEEILKAVPAELKDPNRNWVGITKRMRGIVYNPQKVKASELSTYEDLASPKWKGKLCLRSSSKVYNQSLVAMMIDRLGAEETEKVVQGWTQNLAANVFSDDTSLIKAVDNGPCAVGIVNNYYLGAVLNKEPKSNAKMFWPNQKTSGVHVNITGAALTLNTKNQKQAQEFIAWILKPEAQKMLSDLNYEYPVAKVELNPLLKSFGTFKEDKTNLSVAGKFQKEAVMLMDKVGYK